MSQNFQGGLADVSGLNHTEMLDKRNAKSNRPSLHVGLLIVSHLPQFCYNKQHLRNAHPQQRLFPGSALKLCEVDSLHGN
jgi:hypothetical protein